MIYMAESNGYTENSMLLLPGGNAGGGSDGTGAAGACKADGPGAAGQRAGEGLVGTRTEYG